MIKLFLHLSFFHKSSPLAFHFLENQFKHWVFFFKQSSCLNSLSPFTMTDMWCMASFWVKTSVPNRNHKQFFCRIQVLTYRHAEGCLQYCRQDQNNSPQSVCRTSNLLFIILPLNLLVLKPLAASLDRIVMKLWLEGRERRGMASDSRKWQ